MAGRGVAERRVLKVGPGNEARRARDRVAVEEPLELRVAGRPVGVTMRTPGNDFELAIGYCISERLVARPDDIEAVRFCAPEGQAQEFNVLTVDLRPGVPVPDPSLDRLAVTSSSCGVCGKASIEAVTAACPTVAGDGLAVTAQVLSSIPGRVREAQRVFEQTGGLHAAAVCDADGEVRCVREDVGRHNAVDKVIGWAATERRLPLTGAVLFVSGRCSFEIVQKAAVTGVPLIAAVSAPSSLAVELAEQTGMTLVGFLRGDTMNVYTHPHRLTLTRPGPRPRRSHPGPRPRCRRCGLGGTGDLVVDVEGGGLAGLGAEGAADDGEGRADEQAGTLGRGGLAAAGGQAGPAAEVGADRAPERSGERPGERFAVADRGGEVHDRRGQRQRPQDPSVDQRPPGRLGDPARRRPHRRVVGGPGQPDRRLDPRLGRRDQVVGRRRHLGPGLEHPAHRPLDQLPRGPPHRHRAHPPGTATGQARDHRGRRGPVPGGPWLPGRSGRRRPGGRRPPRARPPRPCERPARRPASPPGRPRRRASARHRAGSRRS